MEKLEQKKQKVALVLSSGGARGMAHIGVIEELERLGFEISSISGVSVGALVGGVYATGNLRYFREWITNLDKLDIFRLMDISLSSSGFIKGDRVFDEIQTFVKDKRIQDLEIPYAAVAADLITGEEVVFKDGSLFEAIKASSAIPTILQPRNYRNRELIDGGVINPIPVKHIDKKDDELLVIVNLNAKIAYTSPVSKKQQSTSEQLYVSGYEAIKNKLGKYLPQSIKKTKGKAPQQHFGYLELMSRSFDLVQDELSELIVESSKPDIYVEISRNACSTFDFYRASELIDEGKAALNKALAWKMINDKEFKV